ncbi:c-type cytochrome biogenesis protein CcmI [Rhodobacteraceae bacterium nBUS_24]
MTFWLFTIGLSSVIAGFFILVLRSGRAQQDGSASEVSFYKAQLADVERDAARGIIDPQDAQQMHAEIARRILRLDGLQSDAADAAPLKQHMISGLFLALALIGGSHLLYLHLGSASYPNLPQAERIERATQLLENRPSLAEYASSFAPQTQARQISEDYSSLVAELRSAIADNPSDLKGLRLLARVEAGLQNYSAASDIQSRVLSHLGAQATADDYLDYAELLILSVGGYVAPEAEIALRAALKQDPKNGGVLYYIGLMFNQNDRPDIAFKLWRDLLLKSPQNAPWIDPIRSQIQEVAFYAGVNNFTLPEQLPTTAVTPVAPALSDDTIESAAQLSPKERDNMVKGMVAKLSQRLQDKGGPAEDWTRLISAYGVLGDDTAVQNTYQLAVTEFATDPAALALLQNALKSAGDAP